MRAVRKGTPGGQRWSTFLRNHAREIWACDFLQAYDVFFRPIFAFVFIELATRKVVLAATTRGPSQAWVTQQLRNATAFGTAPRFLIRDRDDKFGTSFNALARATGIRWCGPAHRRRSRALGVAWSGPQGPIHIARLLCADLTASSRVQPICSRSTTS